MRFFSYRNKRLLRRIAWIALAVLGALALLIIARISYLGRFVVYSDGHAYFDMDQRLRRTQQPPETHADETYNYETVFSDGADTERPDPAGVQLHGYYISTTMLAAGVDEVRQALAEADGYNAVLIDVKSPLGNFYYSTSLVGAQTADADIKACDALIRALTARQDLIVVARVPAFSDPNYIEQHYAAALSIRGGALWMDERRCYWMRPDDAGVQSYLTAIALELQTLGFDEVLFDNFYVPDDPSIVWDSTIETPQAATAECAAALQANLSVTGLRLALGTTDPAVAENASRVFVTTERANSVMDVTEALSEVLPDPDAGIVFVTTSHDTRFDDHGLIRPLFGED